MKTSVFETRTSPSRKRQPRTTHDALEGADLASVRDDVPDNDGGQIEADGRFAHPAREVDGMWQERTGIQLIVPQDRVAARWVKQVIRIQVTSPAH